jgi:hypothetical protein
MKFRGDYGDCDMKNDQFSGCLVWALIFGFIIWVAVFG